MKFVCENCKAKYQIGDEKVAGKTLRMKCRRCGHMIQVSATVTESSVSQQNPAIPARAELHLDDHGASQRPSNQPPVAATTSLTDQPSDDDGATVVRQSPFLIRATGNAMPAVSPPRVGAPPAPGAPPGAPGGLRAVPSPRPSSIRPAGPAPVSPIRGPGPAPAAPPPRPLGSSPGARTPAPPATRAGGPGGPGGATAVQLVASLPAGLSTGFARAVSAPPPAMTPQAPPTEDWYVGVGGVPLGPVRLAVIREKALSGAVDGDSLVWREGFDEWQPLKTFPLLLAMIEEVRAHPAIRPTPIPGSVSLSPRGQSIPDRSLSPRPGHLGTLTTTPRVEGPDASASAAFSDPFGLRSATPPPAATVASTETPTPGVAGAAIATSGAAVGILADPFSASAAPSAPIIPLAVGAAIPAAGGAASEAPYVPRSSFTSIAPPKQDKRLHPMAWAFIAMCAAFGAVAAWAVFLRSTPKPAPVAQATTTSTGPLLGPAPPPPAAMTDSTGNPISPPATSGTSVAGNPSGGFNGGTNSSGGARTAKVADTGAPIDRSGFGSTASNGPSATSDTPSGGGQLSEGEISGVVNRNKPGISRRCWDPAFDQSDGKVKSAKVSASVTIGPSGSVQSVSAAGGDAFPGLASCVAGSIRGWQFPPSDGPTPVSIPFGFNHQ